jgi:hypothetical protein
MKIALDLVNLGIGGGVGFVVGAFTPAVGRKIKAGLESLFKKVATDVVNEANAAAKKV